jgi:hypothetical protein
MSDGTELVLLLLAVIALIGGMMIAMSRRARGRGGQIPEDQGRDAQKQHYKRFL